MGALPGRGSRPGKSQQRAAPSSDVRVLKDFPHFTAGGALLRAQMPSASGKGVCVRVRVHVRVRERTPVSQGGGAGTEMLGEGAEGEGERKNRTSELSQRR